MRILILTALFFLLVLPATADAERRVANNGNLVMEDVPEIPADIVDSLNRYQNVRSASFQSWSGDGESLFINTRFGDVGQLHRVDMPMGARHQVTFYNEPVGGVSRQPGGSKLIFTRDAGGSEFSQIFLLDPAGGDAQMITDGESRNGAVLWDREGHRLAYQSTRRNGASNDIWLADPENPADTKVVLESPDGSWWGPAEFSQTGTRMLVTNYVSITDSRVNLLDLDTGNVTLLAGGAANPSVNVPLAFDDDNDGLWFITDRAGEFSVLAWQSLEEGAEPEYITSDIPWNVAGGAISHDRRRGAFAVNENGRTAVYLFDPHTREYRRIDSIPVVVSIHGGPESQARPAFASTYQLWLEKLGVAVIVPNVRGSGGYGKTYVSLDNGFKREDSVKDIGALLDWIETQPDLDQDRVAVFGGSYGGYMVLASAVHFSDRLKAAVDIVGISSFVTFLENTQDYRRDLRRVEYGDERDPEMRAHLEKISPVNNVEKINIPLFVVQGENDPRVPVTEAIQMVAALRDRGETVWYMNALNEGHGYRKKENRDIYQQATVLFLKAHLLGE